MAVDRYTKAVLTVIAASLVWLAFGGSSPVTRVTAQTGDQRVIIAGWMDHDGTIRALPSAYWLGRAKPGGPVAPAAMPIWTWNP